MIFSFSISQPDKFSEAIIEKIGGVWAGGGFRYIEFDGHGVKGFDEAGFNRYVDTLQQMKVSDVKDIENSVKTYAYTSMKQYDKLFPMVIASVNDANVEDYKVVGYVGTLANNITDKK